MRIFIYTDCHWSSSSSILRGRGEKYSVRLENLIQSVNWAEKMSVKENADIVVCCGDFFDKSSLNSEEISALSEIEWNKDVWHIMIVGNHEMWNNSLDISSANIFKLLGFSVIDKPTTEKFNFGEICFLPYTDNQNILELLSKDYKGKRFVFSHNDIRGIQMGKFVSKKGFSVDEIESCCDFFINGHLHNGEEISNKIVNLGNLTGQNFGENALKYKHCAAVFDTDTMKISFVENPYAVNFYKFRFSNFVDFVGRIRNGVVTVYCSGAQVSMCREIIENCNEIVAYKVIIEVEKTEEKKTEIKKFSENDHIEKFKECIISELGDSDFVKQELTEVCV